LLRFLKYTEGRKGGFDPHEHIKDLDLDGIDAAFLYPSIGLFSGAIKDSDLAWAMCRAYNHWLAEYCAPYSDRLFPVAMLPMQSIGYVIEEMQFARKELGMRGGWLCRKVVFSRPNPQIGSQKINGLRD
jgi:predicted TIM-barrel fold metal-dependent hydrolase